MAVTRLGFLFKQANIYIYRWVWPEPPEESIGRAIGFVVYDHWPRMGSTSMTDGPQTASVAQMGIKIIFLKFLYIFIYFTHFYFLIFVL